MNKLSEYARSLNETHRICTHEMSGHLHLLRFCIDELEESDKPNAELIEKLEEGITHLESLNKLWKICSRYLNPNTGYSLEELVERSLGLARLYNHRYIKKLDCNVEGENFIPADASIILGEALFSVFSVACHFAYQNGQTHVEFNVFMPDDALSLEVHTNLNRIDIEDINEILTDGNENDKTLRRFTGAKFLGEFGGNFEVLQDVDHLAMRLNYEHGK